MKVVVAPAPARYIPGAIGQLHVAGSSFAVCFGAPGSPDVALQALVVLDTARRNPVRRFFVRLAATSSVSLFKKPLL